MFHVSSKNSASILLQIAAAFEVKLFQLYNLILPRKRAGITKKNWEK
jgi:hypothetical protein